MGIKHLFSSPKSDGADSTLVRASNWNADHAIDAGTITAAELASGIIGAPLALTGAVAATRYVGGTASGAPSTGTFAVGDFVIDQIGKVWVCTSAGSPGTWAQVGVAPVYDSAHSDSSSGVTDAASNYDIPSLSIAAVPPGPYFLICSILMSAKSGTARFSIQGGQGWPGGGNWGSWSNADGTQQVDFSSICVVSGPATVKIQASAVSAIGNYTVYNRHLTLIKIA